VCYTDQKWQDPADKVDNGECIGKKYAIADDQEILQEGAGEKSAF
jgi:hypothetical protein